MSADVPNMKEALEMMKARLVEVLTHKSEEINDCLLESQIGSMLDLVQAILDSKWWYTRYFLATLHCTSRWTCVAQSDTAMEDFERLKKGSSYWWTRSR